MVKNRIKFNIWIAVFCCITFYTAISCKKTDNTPEIIVQISDPANPEEIARIINKNIQDGLERARADMGNGVPQLNLTESNGNYFTYKGVVPFYSGASSFERPITVVYNGKTVTYSYDDEIKESTLSSFSTNGINIPKDAVLCPLNASDINKAFKDDLSRWPGSIEADNFKYNRSTGDTFIYEGYLTHLTPLERNVLAFILQDDSIEYGDSNNDRYITGNSFKISKDDHERKGINEAIKDDYSQRNFLIETPVFSIVEEFIGDDYYKSMYKGHLPDRSMNHRKMLNATAVYNGLSIVYSNDSDPEEVYTITLTPDDSRYIIPPKGGTVISLNYPDYISNMPQYFIHLELSNNEVKFLENAANSNGLGKNLYVYADTYQQTLQMIKNISGSQVDGSSSLTGQLLYGYASTMAMGMAEILFNEINIEALPERLYPVNDRRSRERLLADIQTSKIVNALMLLSINQYMEIAALDTQAQTRRVQRLNNSLNNGNKSLFSKVFGNDIKDLSIKGFVVE